MMSCYLVNDQMCILCLTKIALFFHWLGMVFNYIFQINNCLGLCKLFIDGAFPASLEGIEVT